MWFQRYNNRKQRASGPRGFKARNTSGNWAAKRACTPMLEYKVAQMVHHTYHADVQQVVHHSDGIHETHHHSSVFQHACLTGYAAFEVCVAELWDVGFESVSLIRKAKHTGTKSRINPTGVTSTWIYIKCYEHCQIATLIIMKTCSKLGRFIYWNYDAKKICTKNEVSRFLACLHQSTTVGMVMMYHTRISTHETQARTRRKRNRVIHLLETRAFARSCDHSMQRHRIQRSVTIQIFAALYRLYKPSFFVWSGCADCSGRQKHPT